MFSLTNALLEGLTKRVVITTGPSQSPQVARKGTTVFTLMGQVSTLTGHLRAALKKMIKVLSRKGTTYYLSSVRVLLQFRKGKIDKKVEP